MFCFSHSCAQKQIIKVCISLSFFAINTWVLPYQNFSPNESSWTISTLFFWYWCFPFILPRLQRLTDREIARGIVKYFWLSVGIGLLVLFGCGRRIGIEVQFDFPYNSYLIEYYIYIHIYIYRISVFIICLFCSCVALGTYLLDGYGSSSSKISSVPDGCPRWITSLEST